MEKVAKQPPARSLQPAASKILEHKICDQTTTFIEQNNILPPSQHGFRTGKSTMTAWADIFTCANSKINLIIQQGYLNLVPHITMYPIIVILFDTTTIIEVLA